MKCYYEELGIERDAEDKEIKNAYRKLALRYHPDKNLDNAEEAKERFQLIQQAYEVLSDPQERAFYDKHREQILRGKNSNYEENTLDLFQYFTVSCYKGYGDDVKGFYAIYSEVFKKIAAEDAEFMDEDDEDIPEFGDSQSDYENVVGPFYAYWQSYCTKKTYTWLCPYDIQEIKDRRVLRAIDKEMKKIVQNAKRERNEEVRSLVSFVRKRDKRVQAHNQRLEERAALNRKKQEENRLKQILQRKREVEEMRSKKSEVYTEDYEEQLKQLAQEYDEDSDESSTEDDDDVSGEDDEGNEEERELDYADEFFCVACSKAFKNQNAFDNHALSKKHRENEERLKLEMLEEEEALSSMNINGHDDHNDISDEENKFESNEDSNVEEAHNETVTIERNNRKKKGKKSKKNVSKLLEESDEEQENPDENKLQSNEESDETGANSKTVSNTRKKKAKKAKKNVSKLLDESDEEKIEPSFVLPKENGESGTDDWSSSNKKNSRKNQNKKQNKNADKGRPQENGVKDEQPNSLETNEAEAGTSTKHSCATCNSIFESKNKLFAHLKKTNHSVLKTNASSMDNARTKVKGKRK